MTHTLIVMLIIEINVEIISIRIASTIKLYVNVKIIIKIHKRIEDNIRIE